MQRSITKVMARVGVLALLVAALPLGIALAAAMPASGTFHAQDGTRFPNAAVGGAGTPYKLQANLWNKAVSGGYDIEYNASNTAWTLSNNTANSYFPGGAGTDPNDTTCTTNTAAANFDSFDPTCRWAGRGDPWVPTDATPAPAKNPDASTNAVPTWVQPAATTPQVVGLTTHFSDQIHAPASYADIFLGCHWGQCTPGTTMTIPAGAPFPLQLSGISRMDSLWDITGTALPPNGGTESQGQGTWDASYDIWLDTNARPGNNLPSKPASLNNPGQNDGAEIMIWISNQGYNPDSTDPAQNRITPSGVRLVQNTTIPGIPNLRFDVWGGRVRSFDNGIRWNVISFVALSRSTGLHTNTAPNPTGFDARPFLTYASLLNTTQPDHGPKQCSTDPNSPLAAESTTCLINTWWVTSVQAGFEIWHLPAGTTASPVTLGTTQFAVNPVGVSGGMNTGGRAYNNPNNPTDPLNGVPLINWGDKFDIQAQGCAGTTASPAVTSWSITTNNYWNGSQQTASPVGTFTLNNPPNLVETPTGSGNYIATQVGPLYNPAAGYILHDQASLKISITCGGTTYTSTGTVFIDPSGRVFNQATGQPIPTANVTLSRSDTQNGAYSTVVSTPGTPSPLLTGQFGGSLSSPTTTDAFGRYRWDVAPGWYKVTATKSGCNTVTSTPQHVDVGLPAVTELNLYLDCGGPLGVQVQITNDWGSGYCANVVVTNRSAAPVNWQVSFPADGTIYQFWNFTYTPAFQSVTAAKGVSWNQTLGAGQSTHSVGFCANRQLPPPQNVVGQMVQVTNTNDWGSGYCANLKVTNNTSAALNWNVTFPIEGTIYDSWNFTFTRSGNQITAQGVSWNRTLQPGESTHDVGFCANR